MKFNEFYRKVLKENKRTFDNPAFHNVQELANIILDFAPVEHESDRTRIVGKARELFDVAELFWTRIPPKALPSNKLFETEVAKILLDLPVDADTRTNVIRAVIQYIADLAMEPYKRNVVNPPSFIEPMKPLVPLMKRN